MDPVFISSWHFYCLTAFHLGSNKTVHSEIIINHLFMMENLRPREEDEGLPKSQNASSNIGSKAEMVKMSR